MARRRGQRNFAVYCEWPGCTYAIAPGEKMCLEHKREAMDVALAGSAFTTAGKIRNPPCKVCGEPKHPDRPCAKCRVAKDELDELLELDADEVFGE
jgi:hypothetical protein